MAKPLIFLTIVILIVGAGISSAAVDDLYNTLLAHWDFDNLSGTSNVLDVTGNGYDAICSVSSVQTVSGYIQGSGAAVSNQGVSECAYWQISPSSLLDPNVRDLTNGATISVWLRLPASGVQKDFVRVLTIEDGILDISIMQDGRYRYIFPGSGFYSTPNTYNDDQWHQLVCVYDPVNAVSAMYVDGVLLNYTGIETSQFSFTGYRSFIANNRYLSNQFDGDLDDIKIFNYALHQNEIVDLFQSEFPFLISAGYDGVASINGTYTLEASVSGGYDSILWSQTTGPGTAEFSDASVLSPSVQFDQEGTYELEIIVSMGHVSLSDTVQIIVSDKHLLAHWDFDDVADDPNIIDVSGNGYDTLCSNDTVNILPGFIQDSTTAVRTREPSTYWEIGQPAMADPMVQDLTHGATIAVWFRLPESGVTQDFSRALSIEDGKLDLSFMMDGRIRFIKPSSTIYSTPETFNDDQWHHFVGVYDPLNNHSAMYVDGVLVNSTGATESEFSFTGYRSFIANNRYLSNQFDGDLDDIRVFNYAMTVDDVEALYESDNLFSIDAGEDGLVDAQIGVFQLNSTIIGTCTSLLWTQISGPGETMLSDASVQDPMAAFNLPGIYTLQLEAAQYDRTISDTVTIYVYSLLDGEQAAHWNFDGVSISSDVPDLTGNGFDAYCTITNPTATSGYIYGSEGAVSLNDPPVTWSVAASNELDITFGYTLSVWLKVSADVLDRTLCFTPGSVELLVSEFERTRWSNAASEVYSEALINDNIWHHVVAIYDPIHNSSLLYIDGILDSTCSDTFIGEFNFTGEGAFIGGKESSDNFVGELDDIRFYTYSMTQEEVLGLYEDTMPLLVDAGEDVYLDNVREEAYLVASITDHDEPVDLLWSVLSPPSPQAVVTFSDPTAATTTGAFSEAGNYILSIEVNNGTLSVSDTVAIHITEFVCQNVIDAGLTMSGDFNGDCYIDIYDLEIFVSTWGGQTDLNTFSEFAKHWLDCNNPTDSNCSWPF